MKIRILSDLHLDVNSKYPFSLKDKDTFTILCGDTSGDPEITKKWIDDNIKSGVFVCGNHLVYNSRGKSIQELREEMAQGHGENDPVTYLDCMVDNCPITKEIDDGKVLIVGSAMYTNFTLRDRLENRPEDLVVMRNKRLSERIMNDYRWGEVKNEDGSIRRLSADDLEDAFNEFFCRLRSVVEDENNKNRDIIVVTHYCPSPKCISESYLDSDSNSSYVTDMEKFIVSHPNIKMWCCGHVHHQDSFKVGQCLIVMNPRGYVRRCEDAKFDSRLWVDTKDWKVRTHKKTKSETEEYSKRSDEYLALARYFF